MQNFYAKIGEISCKNSGKRKKQRNSRYFSQKFKPR